MKRTHFVTVLAATVLLGSACGDARTPLDPATTELSLSGGAAAQAASAAAAPTAATGDFQAILDFETLTATPAGGNCVLEVDGELVFSGTLEGIAPGRSTARVFAPCPDVLANPPGTFPDVFKSEADFDGTVNGEPAQASLVYQGTTEPGGQIDARIRLSGGLHGVSRVDAQLGVGGSYDGFVIVP